MSAHIISIWKFMHSPWRRSHQLGNVCDISHGCIVLHPLSTAGKAREVASQHHVSLSAMQWFKPPGRCMWRHEQASTMGMRWRASTALILCLRSSCGNSCLLLNKAESFSHKGQCLLTHRPPSCTIQFSARQRLRENVHPLENDIDGVDLRFYHKTDLVS